MVSRPARADRIRVEDLARLPSFVLPTVSWSASKLAVYWDKTGRFELYVLDLRTGETRQVSHGEVPRAIRAGFVWDRTDRYIVFAKDFQGNEQHDLYRLDTATGEVVQLTSDPTCQEYPVEFSPDNGWLTVLTNRRLPEVPDRPGQLNLWKLRADGGEYVPLTRFPFPVWGGLWSPDGEWVAIVTNEDLSNLKNRDGYILRSDGSALKKVFSIRPGSQDYLVAWHPDGRRLAVSSDAFGVRRTGILDLVTGSVRWLSPEDVEETAVQFSRNGRYLLALRNQEAQIRPVVYELETGTGRLLELPAGVALGSAFALDDSKLILTYTTPTTRPTLLAYDLATGRTDTLIPAEYGPFDPAIFVGAEHIYYPSFDGTPIPAILYRPREIPAGARLPAIIHIHGGPTAQWFLSFDPFAQLLVDQGFVVLEPNIRGSTGYGVGFRDAALKDWGGVDLGDVAAGAEYLKNLDYVDPERLVVFGGSYGGYMTFMTVTKKPDLWRAAVAWVGITDLKRMYESSMEHFKYFLREQMGDPEADAQLWADRSPINFAQNLQARLLIVHGVNDPRCPVEQSRIFRDRLLELGYREGVDFEYVEFEDEGHGSNDIEQKIRTYRLLVDFLERVL